MGRKSVLEDWHERASVRIKPRRLIGNQLETDLFCFAPELTPFAQHPLVTSGNPLVLREALTHQLFSYLHFTDRLEHEVVNRTARRIAVGLPGLSVPLETRMDAYKIYCDEAYHSLFSADLVFQIESYTGFRYDGGSGHPALDAFHRFLAEVDPEVRPWFELFFVVVSETLISGSLLRIPADRNVIPAVREMVSDHAEDEIRHHAFFARLCRLAWPQVPAHWKGRVARALPGFIRSFLGPDYPAIRSFLNRYFSAHQANRIIEESYPPELLMADARGASRSTLSVLRKAGVLDLPEMREALAEEGLDLKERTAAATD